MPRRLVALSASGVAAIYLAGLYATQAADQRLAGATGGSGSIAAPPRSPSTPGTGVPASGMSPAPGRSAATPTAVSGYRDGTYQGTGTSRFGNLTVAVTVTGGRIVDVSFTRVSTSYPASRIAALPGQVMERQSAQVDRVTGATASARAFQQAVQQALAQAQSGGAPPAGGAGQPAPQLPPAAPQVPVRPGQGGQVQPPPQPAPRQPAPVAPGQRPRQRDREQEQGSERYGERTRS
jgi:uncharacterized protein with FMN-binding domain